MKSISNSQISAAIIDYQENLQLYGHVTGLIQLKVALEKGQFKTFDELLLWINQGIQHFDKLLHEKDFFGKKEAQRQAKEWQSALDDYSTSFWLKNALNALLMRDPVDALNDAEALFNIMHSHYQKLIDSSTKHV